MQAAVDLYRLASHVGVAQDHQYHLCNLVATAQPSDRDAGRTREAVRTCHLGFYERRRDSVDRDAVLCKAGGVAARQPSIPAFEAL